MKIKKAQELIDKSQECLETISKETYYLESLYAERAKGSIRILDDLNEKIEEKEQYIKEQELYFNHIINAIKEIWER